MIVEIEIDKEWQDCSHLIRTKMDAEAAAKVAARFYWVARPGIWACDQKVLIDVMESEGEPRQHFQFTGGPVLVSDFRSHG